MQKKEQALCTMLYSKHKELVNVDILKICCDSSYFSNTSNLPGEQNFPEHLANLSISPVQFNKHIHCPDMEPSFLPSQTPASTGRTISLSYA